MEPRRPRDACIDTERVHPQMKAIIFWTNMLAFISGTFAGFVLTVFLVFGGRLG